MRTSAIKINPILQHAHTTPLAVYQTLGVAILSLVLPNATLFSAISPFGLAFLSSVPYRFLLVATIGCTIGSLIFIPSSYQVYNLIAIIGIFLLKSLLEKHYRFHPSTLLLCIMSGAVSSIVAFFYAVAVITPQFSFWLMFAQSLLSGTITYFYMTATTVLLHKKQFSEFTHKQITCIIITAISFVNSLCSITFVGINFGVIFGVLSIFVAMAKTDFITSTVVSLVFCIGLAVALPNTLDFCGIILVSTFVSNAFRPAKTIMQLAVFVSLCSFSMLMVGVPIYMVYHLAEVLMATACYVLIPKRIFNIIKMYSEPLNPTNQNPTHLKLQFISNTIRDIGDDIQKVSDSLSDMKTNNLSAVYESTVKKECKGCVREEFCWNKYINIAKQDFMIVGEQLKRTGAVQVETLPKFLKDSCCKTEAMCNSINKNYRAFVTSCKLRNDIEQNRKIVIEQFSSVADIIGQTSEEVEQIKSVDTELASRAFNVYEKIERSATDVVAIIDESGRVCLEIYTDFPPVNSASTLARFMFDALELDFDLPTISKAKNSYLISFFERANFTVDYAIEQKSYNNNPVNGDTVETFIDPNGYAYFVLSDGMGKGKSAKLDSTMTCCLLMKLIKAGILPKTAINIINSSLIIKSTSETTSTIDLAKFDLYTGKLELHKAGAVASYLYNKQGCLKLGATTLPVGILEGACSKRIRSKLKDGDMLIMLSDGIIEDKEDWLIECLKKHGNNTPRELSKIIMKERKQNNPIVDDSTVVVIQVNR